MRSRNLILKEAIAIIHRAQRDDQVIGRHSVN
jgi:hypothetical protein